MFIGMVMRQISSGFTPFLIVKGIGIGILELAFRFLWERIKPIREDVLV
jgi:hypothetical protein